MEWKTKWNGVKTEEIKNEFGKEYVRKNVRKPIEIWYMKIEWAQKLCMPGIYGWRQMTDSEQMYKFICLNVQVKSKLQQSKEAKKRISIVCIVKTKQNGANAPFDFLCLHCNHHSD